MGGRTHRDLFWRLDLLELAAKVWLPMHGILKPREQIRPSGACWQTQRP